jgi:hypothetical protein
MFGFRRRKPAPAKCPANPGIGSEARVGFANGERNWTETADLVELAAKVLNARGHSVVNEKTWLHHPDSGFMLLPQLVELQPLRSAGVRTATTIQVNHPALVPKGVFEYQHSAGDNITDSVSKGFDQWAQTDFVALLEALQPKPKTCTTLEMKFPESESKSARVRRAVLGPVAHFMEKPPHRTDEQSPEEHSFCPCCLLTKSFEPFKELLEGDGLYCLCLYAARDTEGVAQADCRVNGEDWEKGARALRDYADTWPPAGYEFRKQYVVLQTIQKDDDDSAGGDNKW